MKDRTADIGYSMLRAPAQNRCSEVKSNCDGDAAATEEREKAKSKLESQTSAEESK